MLFFNLNLENIHHIVIDSTAWEKRADYKDKDIDRTSEECFWIFYNDIASRDFALICQSVLDASK